MPALKRLRRTGKPLYNLWPVCSVMVPAVLTAQQQRTLALDCNAGVSLLALLSIMVACVFSAAFCCAPVLCQDFDAVPCSQA